MDTPTLVSISLATALGVVIANVLQRKRNQKLAPAIEAALRAQGPLTLPVLSETVGFHGFMARGKVALALNDMVAQGKVRMIAAPNGTPQLQKVNHTKYELTG
ncbi:MAG TPA: hypothetical protein VKQ32_17910 [Polyangia bacterium]|nr:hypothetical protein [Polyangia bacterium]